MACSIHTDRIPRHRCRLIVDRNVGLSFFVTICDIGNAKVKYNSFTTPVLVVAHDARQQQAEEQLSLLVVPSCNPLKI